MDRIFGSDIEAEGDFSIMGQLKSLITGVAPFVLASSVLVTNLNSDLLDGLHASDFALTSHTHQTLTRGSGLTGSNYNGSTAQTWAVDFGTGVGKVVEGTHVGSGGSAHSNATSSVAGFLAATDWTTFNSKQAALSGTGIVKSVAGTISYLADNSANWNSAYGWGDYKLRSLTVAGTSGRVTSSAGAQTLSADRTWTLDLATAGTAGTYRSVTTDAYGRVTAGTNPTTISGYGITDLLTRPLTGFSIGSDTPITSSNTILTGFQNLQAQISTINTVGTYVRVNTGDYITGDHVFAGAISLPQEYYHIPDYTNTVNVRYGSTYNPGPTSVNLSVWDGAGWISLYFDGAGNFSWNGTLFATTSFVGSYFASNSVQLTVAGTSGRITSSAGAQSLAANRTWTLDLATAGTAGTYRSVTTDAYGRVTAGTNPTTISGYGITDLLSQVLTGYTVGSNTALTASDTLLTAFRNLQAQISAIGTGLSGYVATSRTLTINGTAYDLSANRTWSVGTVTNVALSAPTGFSVSGSPVTSTGTLTLGFTAGYSLPSDSTQATWTAKQAALSGTGLVKSTAGVITYVTDSSANWNTAYGWGNHAGLYSLLGHTHVAANITDFTSAGRALISGTGAISYNSSTGVISYTGGAGVGTVTSVGLSAPTGFSVSGSPVTTSGTLALSFTAGYGLPTTAKMTEWDAAYTASSTFVRKGTVDNITAAHNFTGAVKLPAEYYHNLLVGYDTTYVHFYPSGGNGSTSTTANLRVWDGPNATFREIIMSGGGTFTFGGVAVSMSGHTHVASNITDFTTAGRALVSGTGVISYNSSTGVISYTGGTGSGSVTSVGLSAPTGFSVSGGPVTTSGTLALSFAAGYSLPSDATQATWTAKQAALSGTGLVKSTAGTISYVTDNSSNWNTAYSWGNPSGVYAPISHTHVASNITDFTSAARGVISATGAISYNSSTGVISYSGTTPLTGSGTAKFVPMYATSTTLTNSVIQTDGGRVGFNVYPNNHALHIAYNASKTNTSEQYVFILGSNDADAHAASMYAVGGATQADRFVGLSVLENNVAWGGTLALQGKHATNYLVVGASVPGEYKFDLYGDFNLRTGYAMRFAGSAGSNGQFLRTTGSGASWSSLSSGDITGALGYAPANGSLYVPIATPITVTAAHNFTGTIKLPAEYYHNLYPGIHQTYIIYYPSGGNGSTSTYSNMRVWNGPGNTYKQFYMGGDGSFTWDGNTIWHSGNDGAGSGSDMDYLDGQHGSYYLSRSNHTGSQAFSTITGFGSGDVTGALGYTPYNSSNPSNYISSASVYGSTSLTGGGNAGNTTVYLSLVNDNGSPGNNKLYGTNGSGTKGWYAQPSGGGGTIGGGGTAGYVANFASGGSSIQNSRLYDSGSGRVQTVSGAGFQSAGDILAGGNIDCGVYTLIGNKVTVNVAEFANTAIIGASSISSTLLFEVRSTTKASMPFPTMTRAQRLALGTPSEVMYVYQSDAVGMSVAGLKYYDLARSRWTHAQYDDGAA